MKSKYYVSVLVGMSFSGLVSLSAMAQDVSGYQPVISQWKFSYGRQLSTTQALTEALDEGANVNAIVDLSVCTPENGADSSSTKGGLKVTPFRILNGVVSFADTHSTVSTRSGTPKPISQTLRYEVKANGNIKVTSFLFSIPSYRLINQVSFDCVINEGLKFYAVY
ncbi:MAG: hypothetical protein CENE_01318 [Candidatus Celerinatantimonas neptuna]|nr:MAG: hypothetical protein CENE_01318 [Candidatus Celerinatantimonas neptuna]